MHDHAAMKRIVLWLLLGLLVLVVSVVSIVNVKVADAGELPPPDPSLPIVFDDGSSMPLAEVVERAESGLPLPVSPPTTLQLVASALDGRIVASPAGRPLDASLTARVGTVDDPIFALAEQNRADGKLEQALALYLSVPPDSEHYAKSRRLAAWNILARDMDRPEQAVRYANEALHAAPFDGNVWQDWARVYGRTLGLPVD